MRSEYLLVLLCMVFVPAVLSLYPGLQLYRHWRAMLKSLLLAGGIFWAWDIAAIGRGHWSFNPEYVLGISLLGMPAEEWLFFLVLGFVSIFTWESIQYVMRRRK